MKGGRCSVRQQRPASLIDSLGLSLKLDTDIRLTGIDFSILGAGFGTQWVAQTYKEPTFREAASLLLDALVEVSHKINQEPTGILITLDELHHLHVDEIIQFSSTVQHLVREDRQIAVAMAGIPSSVKPLLAEKRERTLLLFLGAQNDGPSQTKTIAQGLDPNTTVRQHLPQSPH